MRTTYQILPASDSSLLILVGNEISFEHHIIVRRLVTALSSVTHPAIRNIHPAYASVLVAFDPLLCEADEVRRHIESALLASESVSLPRERTIEIPVAYGGEFGPDLEAVAKHNNLATDEVVRIHSGAEYRVFFLGFSPGFPYLGGMPSTIATPRLATPRTAVPAGSVAIGGNQTGIYPVQSPGGWRIIGRTPARLFDPTQHPPTLLHMGDIVRFRPIGPDEFRIQ